MSGSSDGSLLAKTARGAGWVVGFRMVRRLLGVVSTLVLVRLLAPSDFGLVALATGFAQAVDAISNLSVHEAIVREHAPERSLYDTAFTMNLIRGLITALVLVSASTSVAAFLHEPRLAVVIVALAIAVVIDSLGNIATADFMRDMDFRKEFVLWTIPRVLQVAGTIGFALVWPSYWALVFGVVLIRVARMALSYVMYPFLPRLTLVAWRRIIGFTGWSWAINIVGMVQSRTDTILIGHFFSTGQVGVYELGHELSALPTSELVDPLCRACFPSFSQLRHRGLGLGETYVRLLAASALLVLPAGMGVALVADPLVKLAFGPKWLEAVPMIQILGISGAFDVIASLTMTLFSATGLLRTTFAIVLAATLARIPLMALLLPGGTLVTAAIVSATLSTADRIAFIVVAMRRFAIPLGVLLRSVWRSLFGTAVMAVVLQSAGIGFASVSDAFLRHLLTSAVCGAVVYFLAVTLAWVISGRPDGPERDLLTLVGSVLRQLANLRPARLVVRG